MISEESLQDLNVRLVRDGMARNDGMGVAADYEVPMDRFRLVVGEYTATTSYYFILVLASPARV